jgi:hypothetical protein
MALSQTDLDNLDSAIATSELRVEFDGRMVVFRSIPELIEARAHVARVLAAATRPARTGGFRFKFTTSRGD